MEKSKSAKTKKLLTDIELGDRKPAALLREIKTLAGSQVTDDFLENIFLQRLPSNARLILSSNSNGIDNIAVVADKVLDIAHSHSIQKATASKHNSRISKLEKHNAELTQAVHELRSRSRSASKSKRTYARSSLRKRKFSTYWYHHRVKKKTKKCIKHSSFGGKQLGPYLTAAEDGRIISSRLFIHDLETNLTFLIDSGANISVIPPSYKVKKLPSKIELYAANGFKTYGECMFKLSLVLRRSSC